MFSFSSQKIVLNHAFIEILLSSRTHIFTIFLNCGTQNITRFTYGNILFGCYALQIALRFMIHKTYCGFKHVVPQSDISKQDAV